MEHWEIDQLNYKVKLIENTLGITYGGVTDLGKKLFIDVHWDDCRKVVNSELDSAYEEMKGEMV